MDVVRGMKANDVDQDPSQASLGSEVCEDRDGAQVSDDGDGEAPPVTLVEGESSQEAHNPPSAQLQLGKSDREGEPKVDADPSTVRSSGNVSGLQLPLEVTVSLMPPQSNFDPESSTPPGDEAGGAPSNRPRAFSYEESLEGDMKFEFSSSDRGTAFASSHDQQVTPPSLSGTPPDDTTALVAHASSPTSTASSGNSWSNKSKLVSSLRRGKWTAEEESYVARVIQDFNSGFLDAPAGTTLRTYLSEKLQCDPMRITKKFTGDACIGKRVFHPAVRSPSNAAAIDKAQSELEGLERRWRRRLEMQQRDHAKKAAASAAATAAAAAATGRTAGIPPEGQVAGGSDPNIVTQTASWLDRAKSVLKDPSPKTTGQEKPEELQSLPSDELMTQMQEVQRLIHEGPIIQQTIPGLPHVVDQQTASSPPPEPADKRLRTGAEDAEALVGFLRSVRASAASGQDC